MSANGIATYYKGTRFRSRLEAKWAYFFDALGWHYEYEPMDLEGYIPDFLLLGKEPCLVEVKPYSTLAEFEPLAANLPADPHPYLIVGVNPFLTEFANCSDQTLGYTNENEDYADWWSPADLSHCHKCGNFYFVSSLGSWFARGVTQPCDGCRKPGMSSESEARARGFWAQAQNLTQWAA